MAEIVLILLIILFFTGYIQIPWLKIPEFTVFYLNGRAIDFRDILMAILIVWAIGELPRPFQIIAGVLLMLWVLSILGFVMIGDLSNLILLAIIIGLGLWVLGIGKK